jgi:Tfp pilus assembly protein PilO
LRVCNRCVEIDDRTGRYQELAKFVSDTAALESIARLIADLAAEKLTLHPGPED